MTISRERFNSIIFIIFGCITYKIVLELVYANILGTKWEYAGFENNWVLSRCILSWLMYVPAIFFFVRFEKKGKFSCQVLCMLIIFSYVPSIVLYEFRGSNFIHLIIIYYFSFVMAVECLQKIHFRKRKFSSNGIINIITGGMILIILFMWGKYARFSVITSLYNVYERRTLASNYDTFALIKYMFMMSRTAMAVITIYKLYKKEYIFAGIGIVISYISFCVDGLKSTLFIIVLGLLAYYGISIFKKYIRWVSIALMIGGIMALAEQKFFGSMKIVDFIYRRALMVPSVLNYDFYDFFQIYPIDYYRQSIGGYFFGESYYDMGITHVIGIYNGSGSIASNGLFSDAYANLGAAGMFIMPIAIAIVLKLLEEAIGNLPDKITAICALRVTWTYITASFFTALLTHGIVALIILFIFLPKDDFRFTESV